ncbi:UNVERIFIED_CONTAM: hypothetical protein NCL1_62053 [Trichonephila clavipes]
MCEQDKQNDEILLVYVRLRSEVVLAQSANLAGRKKTRVKEDRHFLQRVHCYKMCLLLVCSTSESIRYVFQLFILTDFLKNSKNALTLNVAGAFFGNIVFVFEMKTIGNSQFSLMN